MACLRSLRLLNKAPRFGPGWRSAGFIGIPPLTSPSLGRWDGTLRVPIPIMPRVPNPATCEPGSPVAVQTWPASGALSFCAALGHKYRV